MWQRQMDGEEGTAACAAEVGGLLVAGDLLLLDGPLGAGKTTFVRALVGRLGGDPMQVSSPTFTLLHEYEAEPPVIHVDAYRLGDSDELLALGFDELRQAAIACVEWGGRIADAFMPGSYWRLTIEHVSPASRVASLQTPARQGDESTMPRPWRRSTGS